MPIAGGVAAGYAMALAAVVVAASAVVAWRVRVARRFEAEDAARRPRGPDGVVIGAHEIRLDVPGGDRAVLLLHGFNDTPQSMRYLAERLHAAGFAVSVPRLPGHGGSLRELAALGRAQRWRVAAAQALGDLRRVYREVYVCGQSMGGALTVELAVGNLDIPAIALLAPFIGIDPALGRKFQLARFHPAPYFRSSGGERSIHDPEARRQALGPGIVTAHALLGLRAVARSAEALVSSVSVPVLWVQSVHDNRVKESGALRHFSDIKAPVKRQIWLNGSGHIISADYEKEVVADAVIAFFKGSAPLKPD